MHPRPASGRPLPASGAETADARARPDETPETPAAERPLATLFITAYNQEDYVAAAIDGAFAQT